MAIQVRRGLRKDFDPNKMLPGEWAVSIDSNTSNQIVWMCFAAGICKRMGTYEDFYAQIAEATKDIRNSYVADFDEIKADIEFIADVVSSDKEEVLIIKSDIVNTYLPQIQQYVSDAQMAASTATSKANSASESAVLSKSYAVGGTGIRNGEDTDNAKFYADEAKKSAENAAEIVGGDFLTKTGDASNTTVSFTKASTRSNIISGEKQSTNFGKIMKWFADLTAPAFAQVISSYADMMSNTVAGYMLDALAVKAGFDAVNSNLSAKPSMIHGAKEGNIATFKSNCRVALVFFTNIIAEYHGEGIYFIVRNDSTNYVRLIKVAVDSDEHISVNSVSWADGIYTFDITHNTDYYWYRMQEIT